jgi:hypothetical protein
LRFVDFLKTTVLTAAAAATALAVIVVARATRDDDTALLGFALGWWLLAGALGAFLGRRRETLPPIARLLAGARAATTLPEQRPTGVILNRLWPLFVAMVGAGALALVAPQVPTIAAGFAIIWALYWRHQDAAVTAIEDRDGVAFYIERTAPTRPMQLVRTPGFQRVAPPTMNGAGV